MKQTLSTSRKRKRRNFKDVSRRLRFRLVWLWAPLLIAGCQGGRGDTAADDRTGGGGDEDRRRDHAPSGFSRGRYRSAQERRGRPWRLRRAPLA